MAQTYSQRPSEIIGVRDEWAAYQFDLAVLRIGLEATADAKGSGRSRNGRRPKEYRSMKHMTSKKMAIPESGIW